MAKKKTAGKKEVSRKEVKGLIFITYDDGSVEVTMAPVSFTQEELMEALGLETEEAEDDDEDDEDSSNDEDDEDEAGDDEDEDSSDEDDDEDEDDEDSSNDEDEVEISAEDLMGMDFEELEDLCDTNDLETDPDDYEVDDIEKFRKQVAKELGITLPKATAKKESKKSAGKKKK